MTKPNIENPYNIERSKRTRNVLILGAVAAGLGTAIASNELGKKDASGAIPGQARIYVVKQGDTEWGIDQKARLGGDPREFVYQLSKTLPHDAAHAGDTLQPGDKILLPSNSTVDGKLVNIATSIKLPEFVGTAKDAIPDPPTIGS